MSAGNAAAQGAPPRACPASGGGGGGDRIGALPNEVLHRILAFLPAQQAVQTSVLARRWRGLWKSAPGLRVVGADGEALVPFDEKAREFVDTLLFLRDAEASSPLETFELRFAGSGIDVPRVRLWVRYAVERKVQVLRLRFRGIDHAWPALEDPPLASKHLTKLEIHGAIFNGDFLDLSRCPALQELEIERSHFVLEGRISSQTLRRLIIRGSLFKIGSRTRLHAPNLTVLELEVACGRTPILESMPLLIEALVAIPSPVDCCSHSNYGDCGVESCGDCIPNDTCSVLLHGLSQAKILRLFADDEMYIFRRDVKCCPTFTRLKYLELNENWCVPDIHVLACILQHSPVLEELHLCLFFKMDLTELNIVLKGMFRQKELPPTISAHLKRVEVKCGTIDESVVQVLKFLGELNINFNLNFSRNRS